MMSRYIFFLLLSVVVGLPLYAQWQILNEGELGDYGWYAMDFVNDDVGWMVDFEKNLLKTEDFGVTWSEIDITGLAYPEVIDIDFLDETTGWVVVLEYVSPKNSKILFTQDGGNTWQVRLNTSSVELTRIFAIDEQNLYAWDSRGYMLKTNNGGETWMNVSFLEPPDDDSERIRTLWFLDSDIGVVFGSRKSGSEYIARTFDGGQNWEERTVDLGVDNLQFINDSTAYFTASDNLYETTDT
jgi:photosystem II stability/assembly factor-like uncharacterized protein